MIDYPQNHRQINSDLLAGKFLLAENDTTGFDTVKYYEENHSKFYSKFYELSFGYNLIVSQEYIFLESDETNETLSRDICIFFAILCYELDKEGKNFLDEIKYSEFDYDYLDKYFDNSSYSEHILTNNRIKDRDSRDKFIKELYKRNIVNRTGEDRFVFTIASRYFLDFAHDIAKNKLEGNG